MSKVQYTDNVKADIACVHCWVSWVKQMDLASNWMGTMNNGTSLKIDTVCSETFITYHPGLNFIKNTLYHKGFTENKPCLASYQLKNHSSNPHPVA